MQQVRFVSLARWHAGDMTLCSRDALPMLEEWYDGAVSGQRPSIRPRVCGVAGCAEPLVKDKPLKYRLCPAHMKCHAVLRRGMPHRFCSYCCKFHALKAFNGSQRYAPASHWGRCAYPQTDSPLQMHTRALHIARGSSQLQQSALLRIRDGAHACSCELPEQCAPNPWQVLHGRPRQGSGSAYAQAAGAPGRCSRAGAHQAQQRCTRSSCARSWSCMRGRADGCPRPGHPGRPAGGAARARQRRCGRRSGAPC